MSEKMDDRKLLLSAAVVTNEALSRMITRLQSVQECLSGAIKGANIQRGLEILEADRENKD